MARRFQFSLRTALLAILVIAILAKPTSIWLRNYLANRRFVRVTGRVTFDGRPLKDAQVVMVPRIGGKPAQGVTDAGGAYEIETLVVPGIYDVSLTDTTSLVPSKYANASTSGLTISVRAGDRNYVNYDVTR